MKGKLPVVEVVGKVNEYYNLMQIEAPESVKLMPEVGGAEVQADPGLKAPPRFFQSLIVKRDVRVLST